MVTRMLSLWNVEMAWSELVGIFQNSVFLTLMYPTNKDSSGRGCPAPQSLLWKITERS